MIPFQLASAALYLARKADACGTFDRWRKVLRDFDKIRGRIDPLADQNANIDILLRSFEDYLANHIADGGKLDDDTAGLQLHIQLSRLWVIGAYESLRSLHQEINSHDNPYAQCLKRTNSKGCGSERCVLCSIGHLKNETNIVRVAIAKGEEAKDITNPPLPANLTEKLIQTKGEVTPPENRFLIVGEGLQSGVIGWFQHDRRIKEKRFISRRSLSELIISWNVLETSYE